MFVQICGKKIDDPLELFKTVNEKFGDKKFYLSQLGKIEISDNDSNFHNDMKCKKYFLETKFPENKNFKVIFYVIRVVDEKIYYHTITSSDCVNFVVFCSHKLIFAAQVYESNFINKHYRQLFPRNKMEQMLYDDIKDRKIDYIL
jgi:hypothetical protein